jgi:ferrous iron transport protein A
MGHARDLVSMRPGQTGVVARICGGLGVTKRLDAMGIRPGVNLVKVAGQLFGGPVVVQVGNAQMAVGFGMAKKILVKIEAPQEKP